MASPAKPTRAGTRRPENSASVRTATLGDYERIAAVLRRNGLEIRPREDWAALWNGNPAFEKRRDQWPVGWVIEAENGEVTGSISNIPCEYVYGGRTLVAAASCAWAVDAPYRRWSMLMLDRLMRQPGVDLLLSSTVSANAEPAYRAFQWHRAPGAWDRAAYWITGYRGFAHGALGPGWRSSALFSLPVSTALYCWDGLRGTRRFDGGRRFEIERCASFDQRFDSFWNELQSGNEQTALAVRDREALAWHFGYARRRGGLWTWAATRNGRLAAYAVCDRLDNASRHLKRVRLVDYQCLAAGRDALRPLLGAIVRQCRREDVHLLEITGFGLDQAGAGALTAPYQRTLPSWTFYFRAREKELAGTLAQPDTWNPSSFDGDASI